jgi:formate-dependent nitrite reductase membrane component NrfD
MGMDRYVADPHWGGYIVAYFYLGGIAAGAYALAALATLFGDEADRRAARAAHYLAFPLVGLCGPLLIIDLGRPERFWHMLIQSETYRPMFKWWSPMSVGSWGLSAFGAFSFASFLGVLVEDGWIRTGDAARARLSAWRRGWPGRLFAAGGALSAFFLGSYTGVLLSATNQPIWADTTWLAPLFLASAASTGAAAMIVLIRWRLRDVPGPALGRLERADRWALAIEAALLVAFALSLGRYAAPALTRWPGVLIPAFVVPVGLVLPPIIGHARGPRGATASALLVLVAGLVLRAAVIGMPLPWLLTSH